MYTKESLENLRQKVNLVEVLEPYLELKKSGASFKALCPFHDEKNPSFTVQRGDTHYHCFGCGAHGDAVQFLMDHQKFKFSEAVESLAQQFQVTLIKADQEKELGFSKKLIYEALEQALHLFHFFLLHTEEGQLPLHYLLSRGIDLPFIQTFQLGFATAFPAIFRKMMHQQNIGDEALQEAGLIVELQPKKWRDFFSDRITIPILDSAGRVIGFSARKFKEEILEASTSILKRHSSLKSQDPSLGYIIQERELLKKKRQLLSKDS